MNDLHETSMNFDTENVPLFFDHLMSHSTLQVDKRALDSIAAAILALSVETGAEWHLIVTVDGIAYTLVVSAFMDDVDAPDLYFSGDEKPIEIMNAALMDFADDMGI